MKKKNKTCLNIWKFLAWEILDIEFVWPYHCFFLSFMENIAVCDSQQNNHTVYKMYMINIDEPWSVFYDRWTTMRPCCGSGPPGSRPSTVCWTALERRWGSPRKPSPPSRACSRCSPKSWTSLRRRETTSVKQTRRKVVMEENSRNIGIEMFIERVWIEQVFLMVINYLISWYLEIFFIFLCVLLSYFRRS